MTNLTLFNVKQNSLPHLPLVLLVILICLHLGSCTKSTIENLTGEELEEIIDDENNTPFGRFTAQVNGSLFRTPDLEDFVRASISISPTLYTITISAIDIQEGVINAKVMALVIYGTDFNDFQEGAVFDEKSEDFITNGAAAGYAENAANNNEEDDVGVFNNEELDEIYIKITDLDMEKELFSGEFRFNGTDADTDTAYNITEGVFTDIPFKLEEN